MRKVVEDWIGSRESVGRPGGGISKWRKSFPPWSRLLGRREWLGKCGKEQLKAWRKQIFEVQTWRQVRGPARAVMCETRDLGIKWPQWHSMLSEAQVAVYMRVVCPQDVKKMLLKQARTTCWKKWASIHECEELKGVWLDAVEALSQRKTN